MVFFQCQGYTLGTTNKLRKLLISPYHQDLGLAAGREELRELVTQIHDKSELVAVVGADANPEYPSSCVYLWDTRRKKRRELSFDGHKVLNIALRINRLVVVLMEGTCIYDTNPKGDLEKVGSIFRTCLNPKGLVCITEHNDVDMIVCPGEQIGDIVVQHNNTRQRVYITAHSCEIAALAISRDGTKVATSSKKGTNIKIWNSKSGELLKELKRGASPAEIYSLSFNRLATFLAVASDKNTIHIFSLDAGKNANKTINSVLQIRDVKSAALAIFDEDLPRIHVILPSNNRHYDFSDEGKYLRINSSADDSD